MYTFTSFTKIIAGENALDGIAQVVSRFGSKAMIVTDKGVLQNGILEPALASLNNGHIPYIIFDGVVSNPTVENVEDGLRVLQENQCDMIIAVGGGSPMDTAKSIAVVATNGGSIRDYEGFDKMSQTPLPVFTVPTTVGTGSEVTKGAVISDPSRHVKMVIAADLMYPTAAFLDPRSVAGLPGPVCAATGLDALTHALEGYISQFANPVTDALNLHAIRRVGQFLRPAVAGDRQALFEMLVTSCIAGVGFHNSGLGIVHALANTMGGHFAIHHGVANAILLPHVMEFNLISNPQKFADIAAALGENIDGLSIREAAGRAVTAVRQLMVDVDIPTTLRQAGISEEKIPQMAQESLDQIDRPANPRRNNAKDLEKLYRAAF